MGAVARRTSVFSQRSSQSVMRKHRPDYILLLLTVALIAVGVIVVYSISPALTVEKNVSSNYFVVRQLIAVGLGMVLFAITSQLPLGFWKKMYTPMIIAACIATLIALVLPVNPQYPAHRWIRFGGFSFQSVELLKFALIMWLGSFLSLRVQEGSITDFGKTLKPLLGVLVGAGIVVAGVQSDLGSTGVIIATLGIMAFAAGLPMRRIALVGAVLAAGLILAISTTPYRRARLQTFLNPEGSCLTTGYQACQALIAVGSGGMIGLGLGRSVQAYGYLPEAENDSIFAIYAEKFGFVGVTVLLGLFAAFFTRLKKIAEHAPDDFSRFIAIGILVWFSVQALINIGAMIGLLPLKGITLPLISYGGSSVLLVMAAIGVMFQISRYTLFTTPVSNDQGGGGHEDSHDRRRVRGAYHPNFGSRA
jgi:cell division protein FtsW